MSLTKEFRRAKIFGMKYAILRAKKIKCAASLVRLMQHDTREVIPDNADPAKQAQNTVLGTTAEGMAIFRRQTENARVRKDSVLAIQYVITASPEAMKEKSRADQDKYLQDSLKWLKKQHGAENILSVAVHRDEKSPHLHVIVTPIVTTKDRWGREGRSLSAKNWTGSKSKLSAMQDKFFEEVGQKHDLERGVKWSRSKHTTISAYYAGLNSKNNIELNYELPTASKGLFSKQPTPKDVEKAILDGITPGIKNLQDKVYNHEMDRNTLLYTKKLFNKLQKEVDQLKKALEEKPLEEIQREREQAKLEKAQKLENQRSRRQGQNIDRSQGW